MASLPSDTSGEITQFIWRYCCEKIKFCNKLAVRGHLFINIDDCVDAVLAINETKYIKDKSGKKEEQSFLYQTDALNLTLKLPNKEGSSEKQPRTINTSASSMKNKTRAISEDQCTTYSDDGEMEQEVEDDLPSLCSSRCSLSGDSSSSSDNCFIISSHGPEKQVLSISDEQNVDDLSFTTLINCDISQQHDQLQQNCEQWVSIEKDGITHEENIDESNHASKRSIPNQEDEKNSWKCFKSDVSAQSALFTDDKESIKTAQMLSNELSCPTFMDNCDMEPTSTIRIDADDIAEEGEIQVSSFDTGGDDLQAHEFSSDLPLPISLQRDDENRKAPNMPENTFTFETYGDGVSFSHGCDTNNVRLNCGTLSAEKPGEQAVSSPLAIPTTETMTNMTDIAGNLTTHITYNNRPCHPINNRHQLPFAEKDNWIPFSMIQPNMGCNTSSLYGLGGSWCSSTQNVHSIRPGRITDLIIERSERWEKASGAEYMTLIPPAGTRLMLRPADVFRYIGRQCNEQTDQVLDFRYPCHICGLMLDSMQRYVYHTVMDHNTYSCHTCQATFHSKTKLLRHRTVHTGLRNYECALCGKAYRHKSGCEYHLMHCHTHQVASYHLQQSF